MQHQSFHSVEQLPDMREQNNLYSYRNGHLNFTSGMYSEDETNYDNLNKKNKQDPMSHRIIEKRRRDRMNNCLANLSHLIPTDYLKKNRGRIEKTEIIEMAIEYIKHLQEINNEQTEQIKINKSCKENLYMDNRGLPSYKYKTDIKLRFSKDSDGGNNEERCKPGVNNDVVRRTSSSLENCSNFSSDYSSSVSSIGESSTTIIKKNENLYNSSSQLIASYSCNYKNIFTSSIPPYSNKDLDTATKVDIINNFKVPLFALHTKGMFYVPLTIDYYTLLPFLRNNNIFSNSSSSSLHPVTINVNFQYNN